MKNILGIIGLLAPMLFLIGFWALSRVRQRRAEAGQAPVIDAERQGMRAEPDAGDVDE